MAVTDYLPIRDPADDVIKGGSTRIASLSAIVGGLAAVNVAFSDNLIKIFGETAPTAEIKTTILVALIAAWALIAVADLLSRAIVTAAASQPTLTFAPAGMKVRRPDQEGTKAEQDWLVAAVELDSTNPESAKLLVLKSNERPVWVDASAVKGN